MKETDLFEPVRRYLMDEIECEEVYAEVLDTDVLGIKGPANIIVELKTRLTFQLLDQALDRLRLGHYVYIAIPTRKTLIPRVVKKLLKTEGIGLLIVGEYGVTREITARYNRNISRYTNIREYIREYHKQEVGGVPSGVGKTEYSITIEQVKRYLRRAGWSTIDDILEHCETHYAQPKPSLSRTLMEGWNESWCKMKVENGKRYYNIRRPKIK